MRALSSVAVVLSLTLLSATPASAQTRLLRFPDIHGDQLVFTYGGDLWVAPVLGGEARRLTSGPGLELFAKFSPDGQRIAFTAQYGGDEQVYVMPVEGGEPTQLTFYPALGPLAERWGYDNQVYGWTPDGSRVLFRSLRDGTGTSGSRLFTVPADGGLPTVLPMPRAGAGAYSPDGSQILYSPLFRDFRSWKRYEGGWAQDLYIFNLDGSSATNVTNSVRTDRDPMWIGDHVYFASDRDDYLNLYSYEPATQTTRQLTHHRGVDARWASDDGDHRIVYELGGELHVYDVATDIDRTIAISVRDDTGRTRTQTVDASGDVEDLAVSPKGERVVIAARGDVFSVAVEHGVTRNLTATPGAHEREVAWSPLGDRIAYISDATGEEELYVRSATGSDAPIQLTQNSQTRYEHPVWSPDGQRIALGDVEARIHVVDVERRRVTEVADDPGYPSHDYAWSPDSRWLAYSMADPTGYRSLYLWEVRSGDSHRITGELFNEQSPRFAPDGKTLYYLTDRMFAPQIGHFEWNYAVNRSVGINALVLAADGPNPFAPRNEEAQPAKPAEDTASGDDDDDAAVEVRIDFDGLADRVVRAPIEPANIEDFDVTASHIIYQSSPPFYYGRDPDAPASLQAFAFEDREGFELVDDIDGYALSADGAQVIVAKDGSFSRYAISDGAEPDAISLADLKTQRIPAVEYREIFDEVWRRYRDYFYVSNMHGYDWPALKARFRPLVDYVADRSDLNYVIADMISELSVGHAYIAGGDLELPPRPNTALLGATFALDAASGRYRIAEIYEGQTAEPKYRSPLDEVGVDADPGDYVLAINGRELAAPTNPYELLVGAAGSLVELRIADNAAGANARSVIVEPLTDEGELRYLKWVLGNRARVEAASDGRIGYLHLPDMGADGIYEFIKWYYGQIRKQGLIIDVRGNGGGNVSQMIINRLDRKLIYMGYTRGVENVETYPSAVFVGPMATILNENSASDGDLFPAAFKARGLGPLIGKRSWGGVIGITNHGPLIDGGAVFVPQFGHADANGQWSIEGHGVDPDIEVDNPPEAVMRGEDPQLERAIAEVMQRLATNPGTLPPPPAPPVKTPQ
jgi:tricorn protease